jgi:hypothetical protein
MSRGGTELGHNLTSRRFKKLKVRKTRANFDGTNILSSRKDIKLDQKFF